MLKKISIDPRTNSKVAFALFIIIVVLIGLIISGFVFFKIETISINGIDEYTDEEIIDVSGLKIGQNLLFLNTEKIEEKIFDTLPYVENVEVDKKLPFGIEITLTRAEEFYSVEYNSQYVLVSQYGKLLSLSATIQENTTSLIVGEIEDQDGHMTILDEDVSDAFDTLTEALQDVEVGKITEIDLSDLMDIIIIYDNRIVMEIGDVLDLSYKIKFGLQIIEGGSLEETDKGYLSLSLVTENNKAYFSADNSIGEEQVFEDDTDENSELEESSQESSELEESSQESSVENSSGRGDDIPDV